MKRARFFGMILTVAAGLLVMLVLNACQPDAVGSYQSALTPTETIFSQATKRSLAYEGVRRNPVILIHGLLGARLEDPATGKEVEFKSKLVVRVELPDGDSFTAWQCMNFMQSGTMYKTDNDKWQILVNGFTCRIYLRVDDGSGRYREVYRGILCESPKEEKKPDTKWRSLKKDSKGRWN